MEPRRRPGGRAGFRFSGIRPPLARARRRRSLAARRAPGRHATPQAAARTGRQGDEKNCGECRRTPAPALARHPVRQGREALARLALGQRPLGRRIGAGRCAAAVERDALPAERLDPSQVPRIFKEMACRAGLPESVVEGFSGHSARVGAAQDMIAAGIELPNILQAGRWKTTAMVNRYGERLLARRSGAAQLARMQGRQ